MALRAAPGQRLRNPLDRPEQFAPTYAPVRDSLISQALGMGVSVYRRSPDHMARGYADRAQRNVDLSQPAYEQVYALKTLGRGAVNRRSAKAAYELAHEMGHVNRGDSEDAANAWAAHHLVSVLKRLGLDQRSRRQIVRLDQRQLLL